MKLTYFPLTGRGEFIRLIFAATNTDFDDERISGQEFAERKTELPLGQLPVLTDGELILGETVAIAQYVAKKLGVAGDDDVEQANALSLALYVYGLVGKFVTLKFEKDEEKRAQIKKTLVETDLPKYAANITRWLNKNSGYLAANKLTFADIFLFAASEGSNALGLFETFVEKNDAIKAHFDRISAIDGVKKWIEDHPRQ